jgi:hypothetical protein
VKSGGLDELPIAEIQEYIGNQPYSILATYDTEPAFPKMGTKTNRVFGRDYAQLRLDILVSKLSHKPVEAHVATMASEKAGFIVKIEPQVRTETPYRFNDSQLRKDIDNLRSENRNLTSRLSALERPKGSPYTFYRLRIGASGSYSGEKFKHSPFGLNIENSFDVTDISQVNMGFVLFDPEFFWGGYSAYLSYGWKFLVAKGQYTVFKEYTGVDAKQRYSYIIPQLGLQYDAGRVHFDLSGQWVKSLITADVNNGQKTVRLADDGFGVALTISYNVVELVTSTK